MTGRICLVNPRGFCAGVSRAISIVDNALARFGAPVYVRQPLCGGHPPAEGGGVH